MTDPLLLARLTLDLFFTSAPQSRLVSRDTVILLPERRKVPTDTVIEMLAALPKPAKCLNTYIDGLLAVNCVAPDDDEIEYAERGSLSVATFLGDKLVEVQGGNEVVVVSGEAVSKWFADYGCIGCEHAIYPLGAPRENGAEAVWELGPEKQTGGARFRRWA